ncbi:hypothetical protein SSZBM1_127 [Synechococcus phage S-SZBM1]|uniref:Uncharacterized protein n=1 Tax=Synechococcus phage S-SZBM1 TaxID=2926475 RepID=A0AC61TSP0_9CAUD|nr:hypothetical protein PP650_gp149 [Synechococcus phage S-SZBM1]UNH61244.1 hypothetical protein SSZBM1_127 [Synechococcus phage S-SZBM1]
MIEFMLASVLTCQDANQIIDKVKANQELPYHIQVEVVTEIKAATDCKWDAND